MAVLDSIHEEQIEGVVAAFSARHRPRRPHRGVRRVGPRGPGPAAMDRARGRVRRDRAAEPLRRDRAGQAAPRDPRRDRRASSARSRPRRASATPSTPTQAATTLLSLGIGLGTLRSLDQHDRRRRLRRHDARLCVPSGYDGVTCRILSSGRSTSSGRARRRVRAPRRAVARTCRRATAGFQVAAACRPAKRRRRSDVSLSAVTRERARPRSPRAIR